MKQPGALTGADLFILPYGSAFPAGGWQSIITFLRNGGNLLVIGGQPFRVPISGAHGGYSHSQPQDAYSREVGVVHTYQVPQTDGKAFTW
ncbi:MAG: hypothetical protein JO182_02145, partial [Acidobacteriaceae bacterium]|nr:hypothetical protein [Acidobacteriaceae bacterium]